MITPESQIEIGNSQRALATCAFLRMQWNEQGQSSDILLELLLPCIYDPTSVLVEFDRVQSRFRASYGILLPNYMIRTLLERAAKRGIVTRDQHKFMALKQPLQTEGPDPEGEASAEIAPFLQEIIGSARDFSLIWDSETASQGLSSFLEKYCLDLTR